jgi:hypothetical protein
LKEELYNGGLASVCMKQQDRNLIEIKTVKGRGSDIERQNILAKL